MLLQSYHMQLEVYYSYTFTLSFFFFFFPHNIVDVLVQWKAVKTKICSILFTSQWSPIPVLFLNLSPFCCWELNLKIVRKDFVQVTVWNGFYSCVWDSVTVKVVEHPPFQLWGSHWSLNKPYEMDPKGVLETTGQPCAGLEGLGFLCSPGCAAPVQKIPVNKKKRGPKHQPAGVVEEEAHGLGFYKAQSNKSVLPVCWEAAADSLLELLLGGTSAYKADWHLSFLAKQSQLVINKHVISGKNAENEQISE